MINSIPSSPKTVIYPGKDNITAMYARITNGPITLPGGQEEAVSTLEQKTPILFNDNIYAHPSDVPEVIKNNTTTFFGKIKAWLFAYKKHKVKVSKSNSSKTLTESFNGFRVDKAQASLAQGTDIAHCKDMLDSADADLLMGISRGGGTVIATAAEHKDAPSLTRLKLIIAEGAIGSVRDAVRTYAGPFTEIVYKFLTRLNIFGKQHKTDHAAQPKAKVKNGIANVPVLFMSSLKDRVVPISSTFDMAIRIAKHRVENKKFEDAVTPVYFTPLLKSGHDEYATLDRERYLTAAHSVYKSLNLRHDEEHIKTDSNDYLNSINLTGSWYRELINISNNPVLKKRANRNFSDQKETANGLLDQSVRYIRAKAEKINQHEDKETFLRNCLLLPIFAKTRTGIEKKQKWARNEISKEIKLSLKR